MKLFLSVSSSSLLLSVLRDCGISWVSSLIVLLFFHHCAHLKNPSGHSDLRFNIY